MSDEFGLVARENVTNQYLGGEAISACSAETQAAVDRKVVEVIRAQYEKAKQILLDNRTKLDQLAQYLYEHETITGDTFMQILNL